MELELSSYKATHAFKYCNNIVQIHQTERERERGPIETGAAPEDGQIWDQDIRTPTQTGSEGH